MHSVGRLFTATLFMVTMMLAASPGLYTTWKFYQANSASLEQFFNPVLASTTTFASASACTPDQPDAQYCWGVLGMHFITYPAFDQTDMTCDGDDAVVQGILSKVRSIKYNGMTVYYWLQNRYGQRIAYQFEADAKKFPNSRPPGVQAWGPWILKGACKSDYKQWGAVIEHQKTDGSILTTEVGPFPLPKPVLDNGSLG